MTVHDGPRSVRIPAEVDQRLARLAAQTGRSKSFYLRELVTRGADELEYAYGVAARAEAIRAGVASLTSAAGNSTSSRST